MRMGLFIAERILGGPGELCSGSSCSSAWLSPKAAPAGNGRERGSTDVKLVAATGPLSSSLWLSGMSAV